MRSNLKIAFLTATNPNDKTSWSGIHYKMLEGLKEHFEVVDVIGPINSIFIKALGSINRITRFLFSKGYNHKNSILKSYFSSLIIKKRLKKNNYDFIFAPAASTEVAFLKTTIPIFYCSDSSFGQLNEYYETYSELFSFSIKESNYIEKKAIQQSAILSYPSNWAANYVKEKYKPKGFVTVNAFGANIDTINYQTKYIDKNQTITILFLGVEWQRKGGDIVFETFLQLREKHNVKLVVCGCIPPMKHPYMEVIPFLNKNESTDFKKFTSLLEQAHFLFVPSQSECFGIVFCEASAYGIPSISRNTGGIGGAIKNGINGFCLNENATPNQYADVMEDLIENPLKYEALSKSARQLYIEELNWKKWSESVYNLINNHKNNFFES